jgi:hypothetical protein
MDTKSIPYRLRELANEVESTAGSWRVQQAEAWEAVWAQLCREQNSFNATSRVGQSGLEHAVALIKHLQDRSRVLEDIEALL